MNSTLSAEAQRSERRKMMLEAPILKILPVVALPMVISMMIDSIYNLADTYFVSQIGTAATAAVGVNNSLMHFIRSMSLGFGIGAASYISRLLGAKEGDKANRVGVTALFTGVVFISLICFIAFLLRGPLVVLLGATDSAGPYAVDYATYILLSAPFTAAGVILSQLLRAEGSSPYSMAGMVSGCIVNLALDPLFIFAFDWGVAGAAAATGLSKVVSFGVLLLPFIRKKSILSLKPSLFTPTAAIYSEIARMGVPSFLRSALMSVASVVTNNYAGSFGDSVLAAASVSSRITMFIASIVLGFGQGLQPIIGYCWGAKRYRRVRSAFWSTSGIGFCISLVLGAALAVLAPWLMGLFTEDDAEIIRIGAYMVRVQCAVMPLHMFTMIINCLFQAIGRAVSATVLGVARQALFLIPCIAILSSLFGVDGLMNAQPCADILTMLLALPMLYMIMKELKALPSLESDDSGILNYDPEELEISEV